MKYSLLLLMITCGLSHSALGAAELTGRIDGFHADSDGVPVLYGWACSVGSASSIQVDVYMNTGYPSGHLIGRWIEPSEIANGVVFLAKNDAVCGEVLVIDGGMSLKVLG